MALVRVTESQVIDVERITSAFFEEGTLRVCLVDGKFSEYYEDEAAAIWAWLCNMASPLPREQTS